jgi:hypothetical protein
MARLEAGGRFAVAPATTVLFDRDRFSQVARLVDVEAAKPGDPVRE